jgi:hypothetical protein
LWLLVAEVVVAGCQDTPPVVAVLAAFALEPHFL